MTDYQSHYSTTEYIQAAVQKRNSSLDRMHFEDVSFNVDISEYDVDVDEVSVGPQAQFMRLALIHKAILERDLTLRTDKQVLTPQPFI